MSGHVLYLEVTVDFNLKVQFSLHLSAQRPLALHDATVGTIKHLWENNYFLKVG